MLNWKGFGRKHSWPNWGTILTSTGCIEENHEKLDKYSWCPDQYLKKLTSKYNSRSFCYSNTLSKVVWCRVMQCGVKLCSMKWYYDIQCSELSHDVVCCKVVECDVVCGGFQCRELQYDMVCCCVLWYGMCVCVPPPKKKSKQNDQYMPHTTTRNHFIYTYSNSLPERIYTWGPTTDFGTTLLIQDMIPQLSDLSKTHNSVNVNFVPNVK